MITARSHRTNARPFRLHRPRHLDAVPQMQHVEYPRVAESEARKGMIRFPSKAFPPNSAVWENGGHPRAMRKWPPSNTRMFFCAVEALPVDYGKIGEMGSQSVWVPLHSGNDGFWPTNFSRSGRSTVDRQERTLPSNSWQRTLEGAARVGRECDQGRGRDR